MSLITKHTDNETNVAEIEEQFGYDMTGLICVTHNPMNNYSLVSYRDGSNFVDPNDVTAMKEVVNFAEGIELITE